MATHFGSIPNIRFPDSVYSLKSKNIWRIMMNPRKIVTGPVHYTHLADLSEESIGNCEEPKITTPSNEDNHLVAKLTLMASRGRITSEEHAQLAEFVIDQ